MFGFINIFNPDVQLRVICFLQMTRSCNCVLGQKNSASLNNGLTCYLSVQRQNDIGNAVTKGTADETVPGAAMTSSQSVSASDAESMHAVQLKMGSREEDTQLIDSNAISGEGVAHTGVAGSNIKKVVITGGMVPATLASSISVTKSSVNPNNCTTKPEPSPTR